VRKIVHERLVAPGALQQALKSCAALDSYMNPDNKAYWNGMYQWLDAEPEYSAAVIDNGSGDTLIVLFAAAGCLIKGFDHESPLSPYAGDASAQNIYDEVPAALLPLLAEPCVDKEAVTFCVWREPADSDWRKSGESDADDGMNYLLGYLRLDADDYSEWAEEYYEEEVPYRIADAVFRSDSPLRDVILLTDRAHAHSKAGEYDLAVELSAQAVARMQHADASTAGGPAFAAFYELATNLMNQEDWHGAIEAYEQIIHLYPEHDPEAYTEEDADMQLYYWCGQCRIKIRDWDGALKDLQNSVAHQEPHQADALCALGIVYGALKDYTNAVAMYEGALEDYYHNSRAEAFSMYTPEEVWYNRAVCNQASGEYREALRCYREVITLMPTLWKSFEMAGLCLTVLGNKELAAKFTQIAERQGGNTEKALKKLTAYLAS
jgi:tetratricopeptide (TPR) repeat protein